MITNDLEFKTVPLSLQMKPHPQANITDKMEIEDTYSL